MTGDAPDFNPPVLRYDATVERRIEAAEVPAWLAELVGDTGRAQSVAWHGGLWVDGQSWEGTALAAGARAVAYAFEREPALPALPQPLVIWEGEGLLAVNKPAWLPTQGTRASRRVSLEWRVREAVGAELNAVHRLDRETSGVVLFARDAAAAARSSRAFAGRRVEKVYLAAVAPAPALTEWSVEGRMARRPHAAHSRFGMAASGEPGVHSLTHFRTLEARAGRALVAARPVTGRTHQIRVHLSAGGSPIVGDTLYGGAGVAGPHGGPARLQLHAAALALRGPGGAPIAISAPLPEDFLWAWSCSVLDLFADVARVAAGFAR